MLKPAITETHIPALRDKNGRFVAGLSGNPQGRKPGPKTAATKQVLSRLEIEVPAIIEAMIQNAKTGDLGAQKFLLSMIVPKAKSSPADLGLNGEIPPLETPQDVAAFHASVIAATASGRLDSDAAHVLSALLDAHRRALETVQLAEKIARLEQGGVVDVSDLQALPAPSGEEKP